MSSNLIPFKAEVIDAHGREKTEYVLSIDSETALNYFRSEGLFITKIEVYPGFKLANEVVEKKVSPLFLLGYVFAGILIGIGGFLLVRFAWTF